MSRVSFKYFSYIKIVKKLKLIMWKMFKCYKMTWSKETVDINSQKYCFVALKNVQLT